MHQQKMRVTSVIILGFGILWTGLLPGTAQDVKLDDSQSADRKITLNAENAATEPSQTNAFHAKTKGKTILIALPEDRLNKDPTKGVDNLLKHIGAEVVHRYTPKRCAKVYALLSYDGKQAQSVLNNLTNHAGAIIFEDGKFLKAIASSDKKRQPQAYACLKVGSPFDTASEILAVRKKFSGVANVQEPREYKVFTDLKLVPAKGKTLLDIFLLSEGVFLYRPVTPGEEAK